MRPTSASQRIASSLAFLKIPFRRLEKVTCLLVELSILRITIFPLPISLDLNQPISLSFPSPHKLEMDTEMTLKELSARTTRRRDLRPARKAMAPNVPKKVRTRSGQGAGSRKLKRFPKGGEGKGIMRLGLRLWEEGRLFLALGGCNLQADFPLPATCFI